MANSSAQNHSEVAETGRAVAVAAEYDALQGYAWVVIGVGLVVGAATGMAPVYIALGAAFSAMVPTWYYRRYGIARATKGRNLRVVLGTLVMVALLGTAWVLDRLMQPPVSITVLTTALALAVGQHLLLRRTGLTWVHHCVHALVAVAAAGPLWGWGRGAEVLPYTLAVAGAALIVTGIVDHRRLVRLLGPAGEEPAA